MESSSIEGSIRLFRGPELKTNYITKVTTNHEKGAVVLHFLGSLFAVICITEIRLLH